MNPVQKYFPVPVLPFESVDEILNFKRENSINAVVKRKENADRVL